MALGKTGGSLGYWIDQCSEGGLHIPVAMGPRIQRTRSRCGGRAYRPDFCVPAFWLSGRLMNLSAPSHSDPLVTLVEGSLLASLVEKEGLEVIEEAT